MGDLTLKVSLFTDTRYFKAMADHPFSLDAETSIPREGPTWNTWVRPEEVSKGLTL